MKVTRYVNKREGEEIKRGSLLFLNFKLTHNQTPENYIALFERFVSEDPIVHSMGNKYISILKDITINIYNFRTPDPIALFQRVTNVIGKTKKVVSLKKN